MCLYPKLILNRKYTETKKNGGIIPPLKDQRVKYVPVGCQKCRECKRQKALQWSVRLQEEIRNKTNGKFITLTFSNQAIQTISEKIEGLTGYERDNEICKYAIRHFLENWRKKTGKSVRHWFITELGHNGTENVHIHGIIWTDNIELIKEKWSYGRTWIGEYVNEKTINYITKYVTKVDKDHKYYNPKIFTSSGIGSNYINRYDAKNNVFRKKETREYYITRQGRKLNLPIYFRNKIYSEEEREQLWIYKLDEQIRYVWGIKINIKENEENYFKTLEYYRKKNKELGYGDDEINWERKKYEQQRRNMMFRHRTLKTNKKKLTSPTPENSQIER